MGPRSDNRGYELAGLAVHHLAGTSMGPRSDNRGYQDRRLLGARGMVTSMGPRSDNRGYQAGQDVLPQSAYDFNGSTVG